MFNMAIIWIDMLFVYVPQKCDTWSVFKWSTAGLNPEFSFSEISYLTQPKEPSMSIVEGRICGFIIFPYISRFKKC